MKYEKAIRWFIIFIILCLLAYSSICTKELNNNRRCIDTAREQLVRAEEYNRDLTERIGSISANVQKLGELTERNISGVRQCIEIIEETRVIVKDLENICYGGNTIDSYYDWLDSELGLQ